LVVEDAVISLVGTVVGVVEAVDVVADSADCETYAANDTTTINVATVAALRLYILRSLRVSPDSAGDTDRARAS
jgi:hypothetical protein